MEYPIRMIVTDLDGTLLRTDKLFLNAQKMYSDNAANPESRLSTQQNAAALLSSEPHQSFMTEK